MDAGQHNSLVATDPARLVGWVRVASSILGVGFGADDEETPRHVQGEEPLEVHVGSAEKVTKAQIIFTSPKAKRKIHWKSDSWWNGDSRIVQKSYSIAVTCDTKVQGF